jgi:hypothetical protein
MDTNERKTHKVKPDDVKVNDLLAFTYFVKVKGKPSNDKLAVENLDAGAKNIYLEGRELVENSQSADQFHEEFFVSKTKAARVLTSLPPLTLLTVNFVKKDGTERLLRGRLIPSEESYQGYTKVEDLDITDVDKSGEPNRVRQVDNRAIIYLIVGGVKYSVK